MRKGLSAREFARRDGCAESLVRKRVKAGHLATFDDGSIDPELVGSDWRKSARKGAHGAHENAHPDEKRAHPADAAVRTDAASLNAPLSRAEAERVRENFRAEREAYELEVMKKNLVDRGETERAVFGRARAERDAWLNWPLRIAGDMAAEMKVAEADLLPVLQRFTREHLTQLADMPDLKLKMDTEGDGD